MLLFTGTAGRLGAGGTAGGCLLLNTAHSKGRHFLFNFILIALRTCHFRIGAENQFLKLFFAIVACIFIYGHLTPLKLITQINFVDYTD